MYAVIHSTFVKKNFVAFSFIFTKFFYFENVEKIASIDMNDFSFVMQ